MDVFTTGDASLVDIEQQYAEHADALTRFAASLVGPDDAADVVHNTVVSLLSSGRLVEVRDPIAVMYRAVLNNSASWHRTVFRRRRRERSFAAMLVSYDPEHRPEVINALANLSVKQRACVFLVYWEDLTSAQAADRLGLADGTVKSHLARARERLRDVLGE